MWTVEENNLDEMIQRATDGNKKAKANFKDHIVSESEDDESDEYADEDKHSSDDEQVPQKMMSHATSIHTEVDIDGDGKFFPQDEVMVTKNNIQCIVQGQGKQSIKIKKGDILSVEMDLPDLNLVQCKAYNIDKWVSIVVPRDFLTKEFD